MLPAEFESIERPTDQTKSPESWLYLHLYNSSKTRLSTTFGCPRSLTLTEEEVHGQGSPCCPGLDMEAEVLKPGTALVSYLLFEKDVCTIPEL